MMTLFSFDIFWIQLNASFYWLMYFLSFLFWYLILYYRKVFSKDMLDDLLFFIFLGVIIWGRLWYVFFYNPFYFIFSPLDILKVWEWWMSFHWGLLWVIIALFIFSWRNKFSFLKLADELALIVPIGLAFWRLGNYMNQELLGFSPYYWPLAININWVWYFPSTLLELLFEWIILFIILNFLYFKNKNLKTGQIGALFLILYWIFRLFIEIFFREPDSHIWYILWYFTMWEILSLPMIIIWLYYFIKLGNAK